MKKILSLTAIQILIVQIVGAQSSIDFLRSTSIDFFRSTGKIYSVVFVIVLIFVGIVVFLYRLDRKLTKLENQINNEQ
jgi:hypothetical protein